MDLKLFTKAIKLLKTYKKNTTLTEAEEHALDEVITRLKNLSPLFKKVMKLNDVLLEENPQLTFIKETLTDDYVYELLTKAAKKDPQLANFMSSTGGKLIRTNLSQGSAININNLKNYSPKQIRKTNKLHSDTESVYHNFWEIKLRLNELAEFKNFNPSGIRDVRNHLIEHSDKSGAHIFSFGMSTNGPVIRPIRPTNISAPTDNGLKINVEQFLDSIINRLS